MIRKFFFIAVVTAGAISAEAKQPKLAKDAVTEGEARVDVIVKFNSVPGAKHANKIAKHGGNVKTDLSFVNSLHASIPRTT